MPGVGQKNYRQVADSAASATAPSTTPAATTLQSLCAMSEERLAALLQSCQNARRLHWFLHERYSPAASASLNSESPELPSVNPAGGTIPRKPNLQLAKLAQNAALTFAPLKK